MENERKAEEGKKDLDLRYNESYDERPTTR